MDSEIVFFLVNFSIVYSHVFFQFVCSDNFNIHLPLSPSRSGVHYFSLSFGTPPQPLRFVMDTNNSLVYSFRCWDDWLLDSKNNSFPCNSTQCNWFHPHQKCQLKSDCPDFHFRFPHDEESEVNFFSLRSENLTFPETRFDNFIVGCSIFDHHGEPPFDDHMLQGIAGFGRAPYSLPAQMELDSFSYCMLSHDFDKDTTTSTTGDLVLTKGGRGGSNGSEEIVPQYTPFIDNPESWPDYYYVRLQKFTVGNVNITVPDVYQIPDKRSGHGGTIVNSRAAYNFMDEVVFNLVANEFLSQVTMKNNISDIRNTDAEHATGYGLCFNVLTFDDIPKLSLHFDGGAIMDLPLGNYINLFSDIGEVPYVVCLMTGIISPLSDIGEVPIGPTIVLGNYVQQNFYIQFDLKNNRLGLLKHTCTQI